MNIFITSPSPITSANNLCTVHLNKMYQESCQLLANAHHWIGTEHVNNVCAPFNINHPCSVWVRDSRAHYVWLVRHARRLRKLLQTEHHGYDEWFTLLADNVPTLSDSELVWPTPSTEPSWSGRNYFESCFVTYQRYLSWKYDTWQTRTDKKPISVVFVGSVPDYYRKYSVL